MFWCSGRFHSQPWWTDSCCVRNVRIERSPFLSSLWIMTHVNHVWPLTSAPVPRNIIKAEAVSCVCVLEFLWKLVSATEDKNKNCNFFSHNCNFIFKLAYFLFSHNSGNWVHFHKLVFERQPVEIFNGFTCLSRVSLIANDFSVFLTLPWIFSILLMVLMSSCQSNLQSRPPWSEIRPLLCLSN